MSFASNSAPDGVDLSAPARGVNAEYDREQALPQLFVAAAEAFFDKPALVSEHGVYSYGELLRRAQSIAACLHERGLGPGDTIGILASRTLDRIAELLGVLFAGAAYLPLDVESTPPAALRAQALAARPAAILDEPGSMPEGLRHLAIGALAGPAETSPAGQPSADSAPLLDPGSPAYILFTSGSTGAPKGVVVPHRAIARLVCGQQYLPFGADQRYLMHSPLSFDASTLELWAPLLHGATLVVAPDRTLALEDYADLIARHRITTLWLTAAIFHLLARHSPQALAGIEQLIVGGDVVSPQAARSVYAACPGITITNGYGPTESTTFALTYRIPESASQETPLPIGRPLASTTAYILDDNLEPVPDGDEGQLALGGDGVALGYVHAPELDARRFVDDPFSPQPQSRLYLTGDRAVRDAQGLIHFRGRLDQETKIAGHRVSPHEIEQVLAGHPRVLHAVVFLRGEAAETRQLHAVVEPVPGESVDDQELREYLAARLPRFAVPATLGLVRRIPVNSNGKLDRAAAAALAAPASPVLAKAAIESSPANKPGLATVIDIWKTLLETEEVEAETNFFDAGGDSLLLIQLHFQLNQLGRGALDLIDLFSATTPRKMAALLA